jgi:hypothetical protein
VQTLAVVRGRAEGVEGGDAPHAGDDACEHRAIFAGFARPSRDWAGQRFGREGFQPAKNASWPATLATMRRSSPTRSTEW